MNKIIPILKHKIANGILSGEGNFIIEVDADRDTLGSARSLCGDDTFVRADCSAVVGLHGKYNAIVVDESVEERRVSFRLVSDDWREEREGTKLRTALHLKGRDEVEARIVFHRKRNGLLLSLLENGKVVPTGEEAMSMTSLSRAIGIAENFVRTWKENERQAA